MRHHGKNAAKVPSEFFFFLGGVSFFGSPKNLIPSIRPWFSWRIGAIQGDDQANNFNDSIKDHPDSNDILFQKVSFSLI